MGKNLLLILILVFNGTVLLAATAELSPLSARSQSSRVFVEKLKNYKVLFVHADIQDEPLFFNQQFKSITELLKSHGLVENSDYESIVTDINEDPQFSAVDIIKSIRDSRRPVFIWSSSKASADVLEALLRHKNLQDKVKGFISIQGAVGGAEKASQAQRPVSVETSVRAEKMPLIQAVRFLIDTLYSFSNSYSEAMYSLNPVVREKYLQDHDSEIRELSEKVPTLFVSRKGKKKFSTLKYSPIVLVSPLDLINTSKEEFAVKLFSHFRTLYGEKI